MEEGRPLQGPLVSAGEGPLMTGAEDWLPFISYEMDCMKSRTAVNLSSKFCFLRLKIKSFSTPKHTNYKEVSATLIHDV